MSLDRAEMLDWLEAGRVPPGLEQSALRTAGLVPDRPGGEPSSAS